MTVSKDHNVSDEQLADMIGLADAKEKAAKAEADELKAEMKARANGKDIEVKGEKFAVTVTDQISARLDTKAVRKYFGKKVAQFEVDAISTVCRIKPLAAWLANAA